MKEDTIKGIAAVIAIILTVILSVLFLSGCCAKRPEYSQIIMPPTQQEQRIMLMQEQVLRKELEAWDCFNEKKNE